MDISTPTVSPLRQRMLDDMHMRKMAEHTQDGYTRAVRKLAACLGRLPDTATTRRVVTLPASPGGCRYGAGGAQPQGSRTLDCRSTQPQAPRGDVGDGDGEQRLIQQHLLGFVTRSLAHEIGAALALQTRRAVYQFALWHKCLQVDDGGCGDAHAQIPTVVLTMCARFRCVSNVVRQLEVFLFNVALARVTLARICDALAVQIKGFGLTLCAAMYSLIAVSKSGTPLNKPRLIRLSVMSRKKRSTMLSQAELVGVKCI